MSWLGRSALLPCLLGEFLPAFYEPFRQFINNVVGYSSADQVPWTSLIAGASSGAVGGVSCYPVREQLLTSLCSVIGKSHVLDQGSDAGTYPVTIYIDGCSDHSQAYSPALPVGTQHHYKSSREALVRIFRAEGFRGIFRGMDAAVLRTSMGSSVQLPSYNWTKSQIVSRGILPADSTLTFLASSTISGICVVRPVLPLLFLRLPRDTFQCVVMQPTDTVRDQMHPSFARR